MPFRIIPQAGTALPRLAPFLHGLYHFSPQEVEGVRCIFMRCAEKNLPPFPYLGRHMEQVALAADCPAVLSAPHLSPRMQQRLIRERLPFTSDDGALFFPFLGAVIPRPTRHHYPRMTPLAQLVALWHVYTGEEFFYAQGLAERFGVSLMGISTACAALAATGVYSREKDGRCVVLRSRHGRGKTLFAAMLPFLRSPVAAAAYLPKTHLPAGAWVAGESALPHFSRLEAPALTCVAVHRKQLRKTELIHELVDEETMYRVELWHYDPALLGKDGVVDPLSLYLSIEDDGDPRLKQALEQLIQILP